MNTATMFAGGGFLVDPSCLARPLEQGGAVMSLCGRPLDCC